MAMRGDMHEPSAHLTEHAMLSTNSAVLRLRDSDYNGVTIFSRDPALWEAIAAAATANAEACKALR